ncbi:glycoside hydrolase family 2, partial [Candidatus Saccharibacteria bacterium]
IASGVNDHSVHEIVWYKRTFQKPEHQPDENILLHFGAVDFQSTVWINNQEIGGNTGGHVPFSFDITPYVTAGENTLTVRVYDGQDARQPRGKQSVSGRSEYIDYHCTTGIWQTVWLEVVPIMRIDDIRITPLVQENCFSITSILHAPTMRWQLEIAIFDEGHEIVRVSKESNAAVISMRIPLDYPKLWSPDNPHLYTFEVSLASNGKVHDCITSYGGLREIRIDGNTLLFNNEPLYLAMVLDQGYWPESGLTAPTDAAMRKDVQIMKRYGFNGCRKHQKIEDPRWLYWCDKLGLLVWSEMANARAWDSQAEQWLLAEWERAIRRDYNHPSIVAWVPMNESWGVSGLHDDHPGQFAYIEHIVTTTRRLDSTRPVVDNDGWEHTDITDMCTLHDYTPNSSKLKDRYHSMITEG